MFNQENERRLAWQLFFLIVFWSITNVILIVQVPRLLVNETTGRSQDYDPWKNNPYYDPWLDEPLHLDLYDHKMTIIESYGALLGMMYGFLRVFNIMRIFRDDDEESLWSDFWSFCEDDNIFK